MAAHPLPCGGHSRPRTRFWKPSTSSTWLIREKARNAVNKIHSPGLNVVANAAGDIAGGPVAVAATPEGVNPTFILMAPRAKRETGLLRFQLQPQEENPARGYIVSANHQPQPPSGVPVPGYYNLPDRARRINDVLKDPKRKWDIAGAMNCNSM